MKDSALPYSTLFIDIGGVLLTNGWDTKSRTKAAEFFGFEISEIESRHSLVVDLFERGKITLNDYMDWVIFYRHRSFSRDDFKKFLFAQSQPFKEMLELISVFKDRYGLRVVAISNEGRELMEHRIHAFGLKKVIDFFVCSCFVHLRKPDPAIFHLASDLSQTVTKHGIYIDDRAIFVEVAQNLGFRAIHHTNLESTRQALVDCFS
jgi:putative hydrolase of the HAD superfamily